VVIRRDIVVAGRRAQDSAGRGNTKNGVELAQMSGDRLAHREASSKPGFRIAFTRRLAVASETGWRHAGEYQQTGATPT